MIVESARFLWYNNDGFGDVMVSTGFRWIQVAVEWLPNNQTKK